MIYTKNVLNYGMVSKKIFKFKDTDTEKAIELIKYFNPFIVHYLYLFHYQN